MNMTSQNSNKDEELKENSNIKVVDYLQIRDVQSEKIILRQRGTKNERKK